MLTFEDHCNGVIAATHALGWPRARRFGARIDRTASGAPGDSASAVGNQIQRVGVADGRAVVGANYGDSP